MIGYRPESGYELEDLFVRKVRGRSADGRVLSDLVPTGAEPRCRALMEALGFWRKEWSRS